MKPNDPVEDDQRLSQLLKEWRVETDLPPRFRDRVWQRIEQPEHKGSSSLLSGLRKWFEQMIPRPALALSYVTLLVVIGAGAGWTQGRIENKRADTALRLRYVQTVDPYQSTMLADDR